MNHTPGPWIVMAQIQRIYVMTTATAASDKRTLASVPDATTPAAHQSALADAQLMAAAPELLSALQVIVTTPYIWEFLSRTDPKALAQAELSIAKATA